MSKTADILFEYLRDVLYTPQQANLDVDALPEDFKQLGQGLQFFTATVVETREFAAALSRGDLEAKFPSRDNEMAAPLKALHASLRHMTWQSQQVAKGDYQQRLEFLGDFAQAFNEMVCQLDQRQKALLAEIESGKKKTLALEQGNSLLVAITEHTSQWIIVVENSGGEWLYMNQSAQRAVKDETLRRVLSGWFSEQSGAEEGSIQEDDLELTAAKDVYYCKAAAYPVQWGGQQARAYILNDISAEHQRMQQLEDQAYRDALTGLSNRYYSMQQLTEWLKSKRKFCVCFADLDNLKYVNDNLGHSEGDTYIISAAQLLRRTFVGGVVGRLGGDEFMLLVQGATQAQVEAKMEHLRDELLGWTPPPGGSKYFRSISYGVVQVEPGSTLAASDLLGLADERMYTFKRAHKCERASLMAQ